MSSTTAVIAQDFEVYLFYLAMLGFSLLVATYGGCL